MNENERAICARVKLIREQMGSSQPTFASRLGLSLDQLASIEYGRSPLRYIIAWQIHQEFDVNLAWLCDGVGSPAESRRDAIYPSLDLIPNAERVLLSEVSNKLQTYLSSWQEPHVITAGKALMKRPPGDSDLRERWASLSYLEEFVDTWVASVPPGHVSELADAITRAATSLLARLPAEPVDQVNERSLQLAWKRMRMHGLRKALGSKNISEGLTHVIVSGNNADMKSPMKVLLDRLNAATSERGMKSRLAKFMGVPLANVSQWLSGDREPSGENTLKLLKWVEQQERSQ